MVIGYSVHNHQQLIQLFIKLIPKKYEVGDIIAIYCYLSKINYQE